MKENKNTIMHTSEISSNINQKDILDKDFFSFTHYVIESSDWSDWLRSQSATKLFASHPDLRSATVVPRKLKTGGPDVSFVSVLRFRHSRLHVSNP